MSICSFVCKTHSNKVLFRLLNGEITFLVYKNIELRQWKNLYFLREFVHGFVKLKLPFIFSLFFLSKKGQNRPKQASVK